MSHLLMIIAHPHTDLPSATRTVATHFLTAYQAAHPTDDVQVRDLFQDPVPALDDTVFTAWTKQKYGHPLTAAETQSLATHTAWLDQFLTADKIVFANPMYNHFLPAELKQYIDVTAVARKTFRYTAQGPVGLCPDKRVLHIQAAGALYHQAPDSAAAQEDFGDGYLRSIMTLYGITDFQSLFIEGLDQFADQRTVRTTTAVAQAEKLAATF